MKTKPAQPQPTVPGWGRAGLTQRCLLLLKGFLRQTPEAGPDRGDCVRSLLLTKHAPFACVAGDTVPRSLGIDL